MEKSAAAATLKLTDRDETWSSEMMKLTCREAMNSGYLEILDHSVSGLVNPEVLCKIQNLKAAAAAAPERAREGVIDCSNRHRELTVPTSATQKFKFLLSNFVKSVLLGIRTLFSDAVSGETGFFNAAEFLNCVLNVLGNPPVEAGALAGLPSQGFLTGQTLEEIYQETIGHLVSRNPTGNAEDDLLECQDLELILKSYARHTTVLLLSLGIAKDDISAAAIFQMVLTLVGQIVLAKRLDFDGETEEALADNSFVASSTADTEEED